jgi:hypothetical protein
MVCYVESLEIGLGKVADMRGFNALCVKNVISI